MFMTKIFGTDSKLLYPLPSTPDTGFGELKTLQRLIPGVDKNDIPLTNNRIFKELLNVMVTSQ
jgi:hypothetical protein